MATFHYSLKVGNSGKAKFHYDYIMKKGKYALRENEDLLFKKNNNFPSWVTDPRDFWTLADQKEKTVSYREIEVALLEELSDQENIEFLENYVKEKLSTLTYSVAIHSKPASLDPSKKNIHAHLMFYEREIDFSRPEPERDVYFRKTGVRTDGTLTGGYIKNRLFPRPAHLRELREDWEKKLNDLLTEKKCTQQVSCKSIKMQKQAAEKSKDLDKAESLERDAMPRKTPAWIYRNLKKIVYYRQNKDALNQEIDLELKQFCLQEEIVKLKQQILFQKIQDREIIPQDYEKITRSQLYEELKQQSKEQQKKVTALDKEVTKLKSIKLNTDKLEESVINKLLGGKVKAISDQMRSKDSLVSLSIKKIDTYKEEHKDDLMKPGPYEGYQNLIQEQRKLLADLATLHTEKTDLLKKYQTPETRQIAEQLFKKYAKENYQKLSTLQATLDKEVLVLAKTDHTIQCFKDAYMKRDKVAIQSIRSIEVTARSVKLGVSMIKEFFNQDNTEKKIASFIFKTDEKEKEKDQERGRER